MHDVIVIGAGPAGLAGAAYTLQHHLTTLVIAPSLGGKALYRLKLPWVEGHEVITGEEAVEQLRAWVLHAPNAARRLDTVEQVFLHGDTFHVVTEEGSVFSARAVIVATGVTPRRLGVIGEERLFGRGVTYSATSHAPLFSGRRVVVIGGDLRALRAAAELCLIAEHVTLIVQDRNDLSRYALGQQLSHDDRVTILERVIVAEIVGDAAVAGVVVATQDGSTQTIPADGVFIELGLVAHSAFLGSLVERTSSGQIIVNDRCATSCAGLFAAGDITSTAYAEQILIALGEGARAGLSACAYLLEGAAALQRNHANTQPAQPVERPLSP